MAKYVWKDIVKIGIKITTEEFPISGETDGDENDIYYDISDFLNAVANKYHVEVDEIKTYMMDNIEFDPQTLAFGAESCGCYIDGVAEWCL